MKFYCSLILISLNISTCALASKVIIYYHTGKLAEAKITEEIFNKKFLIPHSLIIKLEHNKCYSKEKRFLELCINDKGELIELSKSNIKKIKKSLAVFAKPEVSDV